MEYFAKSAEIRLEAGRVAPVPVAIRAWVAPRPDAAADALGYFHANWRRTTPVDVGLDGHHAFAAALVENFVEQLQHL